MLAALDRARLADFLAGERQAWVFVFKCLLALYAAAGLSMLLELQQPATAMVTVGIVMHPQSGMVRAKGFYRAIGNVAGCVCAVVLIAAFPQQPELFLPCLCLWVAICAGGAMAYRNFMSYGFVLSGYTTAIVALPAISDPLGVFDSAVMRMSEVLLGVIVSGIVSDMVFPQRLGDVLRHSRREHFDRFIALAGESLHGRVSGEAMERAHLDVVRAAVQLEDLRSSVVFEEPESRSRSRRMQLHNLRYMAAATTFQSLHNLVNRLLRHRLSTAGEALVALYAPVANALAATPSDGTGLDDIARRLASCESELPTRAATLRDTYRMPQDTLLEFDSGAALVFRFASELRDLTALEASLRKPHERGPRTREPLHFKRSNDYVAPVVTVVRGLVTLAILCLFWIYSTWPSALSAVLTASYFLGLLASSPSPVSSAVYVAVGYALGITGAFATEFYLMPGSDGFTMLVATTLPLLLIGPYLMTRAATLPGMGTGYIMAFAGSLALKNPMVYNPEHFINDAIASFLGVVACAVAFLIVPTVIGTAWLRDRQLRKLRGQVKFVASAPMRGLLYRAESANRDLLHQIVQFTEVGSIELKRLLTWGLAVHECVRAIIELRQDAEHPDLPSPLKDAVQHAVESVAALYDDPASHRWQHADETIGQAVTLMSQALPQAGASCRPPLAHLLQLRAALRDNDSALSPYQRGQSRSPA